METTEVPIETKMIKGFTVKTFITIITCTIAIVASTVGVYYNLAASISKIAANGEAQTTLLNARMDRMDAKGEGDAKYMDLRFKTVEIGLEALRLEVHDYHKK